MGMIDAAVKKNLILASGNQSCELVEIDYSRIGKEMKSAVRGLEVCIQIPLDGRVIAKQIVKPMDQELAKISKGR